MQRSEKRILFFFHFLISSNVDADVWIRFKDVQIFCGKTQFPIFIKTLSKISTQSKQIDSKKLCIHTHSILIENNDGEK